MKDVTTRLYIVSTYQTNKTDKQNYSALVKAQTFLGDEGISVDFAERRYNGENKKALVVSGDNNVEKYIRMIAEQYNQESYLVVYHDNAAELVYVNHPPIWVRGSRYIIGTWTPTEDLTLSEVTVIGNKAYYIK